MHQAERQSDKDEIVQLKADFQKQSQNLISLASEVKGVKILTLKTFSITHSWNMRGLMLLRVNELWHPLLQDMWMKTWGSRSVIKNDDDYRNLSLNNKIPNACHSKI